MSSAAADSDESLFSAFRSGDAVAMEVLFRRYRRHVYGWLVRMLSDGAEAEDVYQEVWLRIIRNAGDYRLGSFRSWLWRIVHNCTIDRLRKKMPDLTLDEPVSEEEDAGAVVDRVADTSAVCVPDRIDADERRRLLRQAVDRLSVPLRTVVLMRINGELEFAEIAEMLDLPLGTVLARMHRAVKWLSEYIAGKGDF